MSALEDVLTRGATLGGWLCRQACIRNFVAAVSAFTVLAAPNAPAGRSDTAQFGQITADGSVAKVDRQGRERRVARVRRFACHLHVLVFRSVFLLQVSVQNSFPLGQQMPKMIQLVVCQSSHETETIAIRNKTVWNAALPTNFLGRPACGASTQRVRKACLDLTYV